MRSNALPPSNVVLIGPRGSGKTTVARMVAERLGWPWRDADADIVATTGRSVPDLFADEGEATFRQYETDVLARWEGLSGHVLATGGGVVIRPENRARLRGLGHVVLLSADAATLWQRLVQDSATAGQRPALTALAGPAEVQALLAAREPWYRECADRHLNTAGRTPVEVTEDILLHLPWDERRHG